ncbi:hypothetical protein [Paraburkholderia terricola]|uniref:hypothetical protein n=1 Tax=Paraburkholderia terricola TaxID=169427 RepID=UPI003ECF71C4
MNIYRCRFVSACPNNNSPIIYDLTIESQTMVHVEHITTACAMHKSAFHEAIADDLFERFGGHQTLTAHHHGVDIETRRGFGIPSGTRLAKRVSVGTTVFEKGTCAELAHEAVNGACA